MYNTFYITPCCEKLPFILTLNEEESKHCSRVLHLKKGATVQLVDGLGGFYTAEIVDAHPLRTTIKVINKQCAYGKRAYNLHIAIAPTKNLSRTEWFIEKATEVGVEEISFLICQHSERKLINMSRIAKIVQISAKQSVKAYFPKLNPPTTFKNFLKKKIQGQKFIAHCKGHNNKETLKSALIPSQPCQVLIGPEGDFSEEELAGAQEYGYVPISLGKNRLRSETAGLAVCFEVSFINHEKN